MWLYRCVRGKGAHAKEAKKLRIPSSLAKKTHLKERFCKHRTHAEHAAHATPAMHQPPPYDSGNTSHYELRRSSKGDFGEGGAPGGNFRQTWKGRSVWRRVSHIGSHCARRGSNIGTHMPHGSTQIHAGLHPTRRALSQQRRMKWREGRNRTKRGTRHLRRNLFYFECGGTFFFETPATRPRGDRNGLQQSPAFDFYSLCFVTRFFAKNMATLLHSSTSRGTSNPASNTISFLYSQNST